MLALSLLSQLQHGGFSLLAMSISCLISVSGGGKKVPSFNIVGCLENSVLTATQLLQRMYVPAKRTDELSVLFSAPETSGAEGVVATQYTGFGKVIVAYGA